MSRIHHKSTTVEIFIQLETLALLKLAPPSTTVEIFMQLETRRKQRH